jgi:hypothetical protein
VNASAQGLHEQDSYTEHTIDVEAREALNVLNTNLTALAAEQSAEQQERTWQFNQMREAAEDAQRDLAALARSSRRLAARVRWLEQRLRADSDVPPADLDQHDPELLELAGTVLTGRNAEEGLLYGPELESVQRIVDSFARLELERDQAMADMLTVSAALESTRRDDPERAREVARFAAAEQRLAFSRAAVEENQHFARAAREQLAQNDERRTALAPVIDAGRLAQDALEAGLRNQLGATVAGGALPPTWFTADLGPAPAESAEPAWLAAAAGALAYRLVYGIDDSSSVLGPRPGESAPKHQAGEYDRLSAELDALDA